MFFEGIDRIATIVELNVLKENPDIVFSHFMSYGDEVFYVLKDGKIYGIITPGDLCRSYSKKTKVPQVNRSFSYIESKDDHKEAKEIFDKYQSIHEIAVVKDGYFLGRVKSGNRKSWEEWKGIRESFFNARLEMEHTEWIKKDINRLLGLKGRIYVYRLPRMEDMRISDEEYIKYEAKSRLSDEGLTVLTLEEQKAFFGDNHCPGYAAQVVKTIKENRIIYKNGIPEFMDRSGEIYNIKNGYRVVPKAPKHAEKKIVMAGPCTMFGAFVTDAQTIENYLQEIVLDEGFCDYGVVNCSVNGDISSPRLLREETGEEDIIILMSFHFDIWRTFEEKYPEKIKCLDSMSEIWEEIANPVDHIFNSAGHCNHVVNKKVAEKMFRDIKDYLCNGSKREICRDKLQEYYISWDVAEYYKRYLIQFSAGRKRQGVLGAVVMNCNPFTKGHRSLIEYAYEHVDYLYIFVVETDRSTFSFKDRMEMVKCGTADLERVCIIPTGKYLISERTFMQYFKKEQVHNVEDMDYDMHIFGEVIAKELGITRRFAGEEPFDRVTAKYNETMRRILPEYGIEFVEIPRKKDNKGEIISASKVREYIAKGRNTELKDVLPDSTLKYLKERLLDK